MKRISRSRPRRDRLRVPPRGTALRTVRDCASRTAVRLMLTGTSTPPLTSDRPATPSAQRRCDARKTNARCWRPPLRHIVGGVGRERLVDNDSVVGDFSRRSAQVRSAAHADFDDGDAALDRVPVAGRTAKSLACAHEEDPRPPRAGRLVASDPRPLLVSVLTILRDWVVRSEV
jgi:hypothetical protein